MEEKSMENSSKVDDIHRVNKIKLKNRLNIVIGQVNGVKKMIEYDRNIDAILMQIMAIEKAMKGIFFVMLEQQINKYLLETNIIEDEKRANEIVKFIQRHNK